jgi:hypothetical protein
MTDRRRSGVRIVLDTQADIDLHVVEPKHLSDARLVDAMPGKNPAHLIAKLSRPPVRTRIRLKQPKEFTPRPLVVEDHDGIAA